MKIYFRLILFCVYKKISNFFFDRAAKQLKKYSDVIYTAQKNKELLKVMYEDSDPRTIETIFKSGLTKNFSRADKKTFFKILTLKKIKKER